MIGIIFVQVYIELNELLKLFICRYFFNYYAHRSFCFELTKLRKFRLLGGIITVKYSFCCFLCRNPGKASLGK